MTLKSYLWGMRIGTLLFLIVWLVAVQTIDPSEARFVEMSIFYLSLWMFLSGTFVLFLTWVRRIFAGGEATFLYLGMSFRQGVLLALIFTLLLLLQGLRMLTWWDGLLAASGIFLIELYFLSR